MSSTVISSAGSSHGAVSSTRTLRLVRVAGGASPFVWRGLLPLLGLAGVTWFGIAPFASRDVEATVTREVRSHLVQKDLGWVNVAVSGQEVLLTGSPPRAGAGDEALALARAATCPTWAGPMVCAVTVLGAFTAPAAAAVAPMAAPAATAAAAACEAALAKLLATSRIEFASGGAGIDARSAKLLDQLAEAALGCPGKIRIEGHTDNVGDAASNQRLSEARAQAVIAALEQRGLRRDRLAAIGHGETKPLADNGDAAGRAANRRIDFKAQP